MANSESFEFIKKQLRIFNDDFNDEIEALIEAGKTDIEQSTGKVYNEDDYMQLCALTAFVKSRFGENEDAEKYEVLYQKDLAKLGIQRLEK